MVFILVVFLVRGRIGFGLEKLIVLYRTIFMSLAFSIGPFFLDSFFKLAQFNDTCLEGLV